MLILRKNLVNLNLRIAGYILIAATSIPGIGATSGIIGVFYPSNLAFSMVCVLIAAIIFQKNILIGLSAGLVTLCNPSSGLIVLIIFIIPVLIAKFKAREKMISIVLPLLVTSTAPLYFAITRNLRPLDLSDAERINLRIVSRMPHHYSYQEFSNYEYINLAIWLTVLLFTMHFTAKNYQNGIIKTATIILITLMIASGIASISRSNFFLIELRPQRLSPMITFIGFFSFLTLSQVLLSKRKNQFLSILTAFIGFLHLLPSLGTLPIPYYFAVFLSPLILEITIVVSFIFMLIFWRGSRSYPSFPRAINSLPIVIYFIIILLNLYSVAPNFNKPRDSIGMIEIYSQASKRTLPGDIFMIPPNWDSFPYFTKRAVIVDWGTNPFGKGEDEYIERLRDVVGSSKLFNFNKPTTMRSIDIQMGSQYEKNLSSSRLVLCKYDAKYVISTNPIFSSDFLTPIFRNASGTILKLNKKCPI
jgi:hypothetical protein